MKFLLKLRNWTDFASHLNELLKKGAKTEVDSNSFDFPDLDDYSSRSDIFEVLKVFKKYVQCKV